MTEDKLDKVRKLLVMAERTSNEHEAEAFLAKAQAMMTEYGIDEAIARRAQPQVADAIGRETITIPTRTQLIKAKRVLLSVIATHNNCIVLVHTDRIGGRTAKYETLTGYAGDRERVKLLFSSLLIQMERAMRQSPNFRNDITYRNNFAWAYAARINQRLASARQDAWTARGGAAEVALRDTMDEVKASVGKVKKAPQGKRRAYDGFARLDGDAAGNRAVLEDRLDSAPSRAQIT